MKRVAAVAVAAAAALTLAPGSGAAPGGKAGETVTMSGRAYEFNHMDTFIEGAAIRVRELPGVSATTDANGDYELELPDDATVTPYIDPPEGYNEIDLQTFHTRGRDIENANFQTPADLEYGALAALLDVPMGPDGRPVDCAIVTTASARNVRGVPYETFWDRTPHGVEGATSQSGPPLPEPTYFNENVIPDPTQPSTSDDGGIIWTEVPAGTYRIGTSAPGHRFASFLATCKPGRVVNANPPWGAYELTGKERPLSAGVAVGTVRKAGASRKRVRLRLRLGEPLRVRAKLRGEGRALGGARESFGEAGRARMSIPVPKRARGERPRLGLRFTDASGSSARAVIRVRIPG